MPVTLTCYGGVNQIGGNQILLEDGDDALFFDFGMPYAQRGRFYEEYLKPRAAFGLLDPLTTKLLPPLRGLYRPDMEQGASDLWDAFEDAPDYRDLRDTNVRGVLLSHAHLDHSGYLSFLRPDIAVIASGLTAFVAKAVQDSSRTDFESEVVYAVPRELTATGLLESGPWRSVAAEQRPFATFDAHALSSDAHVFWQTSPAGRPLAPRPLQDAGGLDALEVKQFPVDHSVPGASAYAIKTSAGWIVYTGDLRFHGGAGDLTQQFLREVKALKPTVLLCEGTRINPKRAGEHNYTEQDVYERAFQEIRKAQGLVIADFGPRNVERLLIFIRIAKEVGRALVVLPRDAYLLKALHLADPSTPSVMDVPDLLVFDEPRISYVNWEKAIRNECKDRLVSPQEVRAKQSQYILCFSFFDLDQLPTLRPQPGSLYLYSSHEAFNSEVQMDFKRLREWVRHFDMHHVGLPLEELDWQAPPDERGLHASGHASHNDLMEMVGSIAPQVVAPVHTENAQYFVDAFQGTGIRVEPPSYGQPIRLV